MSRSRKGGHRELLLRIFDSLYSAFGPQHWWPVNGHPLMPRGTIAGPIHASPMKGGERYYAHSPGRALDRSDGIAAFEMMVGAILTQNTAWTNVERAIENLRMANCLNPDTLHKIPASRLARLIRPSGYFNIKAHRLKSFVGFLFEAYGGDIRRMLKEKPDVLRRRLLSVKGIGPETADSILLYAANLPWFVVDAYTRRIFSRHGLVEAGMGYEGLQDFFMKELPRDPRLYNEYHALIVRLGKDACRRRPDCERCPLLKVLGEPVLMP